MRYFVIFLVIVILLALVLGINPNPYYAMPALFGEESIFNRIGQATIDFFMDTTTAIVDIWEYIKNIFGGGE